MGLVGIQVNMYGGDLFFFRIFFGQQKELAYQMHLHVCEFCILSRCPQTFSQLSHQFCLPGGPSARRRGQGGRWLLLVSRLPSVRGLCLVASHRGGQAPGWEIMVKISPCLISPCWYMVTWRSYMCFAMVNICSQLIDESWFNMHGSMMSFMEIISSSQCECWAVAAGSAWLDAITASPSRCGRDVAIGFPSKAVENSGKTKTRINNCRTFFSRSWIFNLQTSPHFILKKHTPTSTSLETPSWTPHHHHLPQPRYGCHQAPVAARPYDFTSWVKMANILAKAAARKEDLAPWRNRATRQCSEYVPRAKTHEVKILRLFDFDPNFWDYYLTNWWIWDELMIIINVEMSCFCVWSYVMELIWVISW